MLFGRQRLVLSLLEALGGQVAHTDFQKLLFLFTQEWESAPSYDFVPYRFGCFSFTSYADKRRLIERGLLRLDDQHWALSERGRTVARRAAALMPAVPKFAQRYRDKRGDPLIREVYLRHPYYAVRSEILERVLPCLDDRARVAAARPPRHGPGLVTIGYEGKSLERYLNQLLGASVTLLCDVRRNPLSRKYGFAKSTLGKACEGMSIRYEHLPELGIDSEKRQALITQADYDHLFAAYERHSLPRQGAALKKIRGWIQRDGHRVALTCYEAHPGKCHRHCVADALADTGGQTLLPLHL